VGVPPSRTGQRLILLAAEVRAGKCTPAQHDQAEVLNTSGQCGPVRVPAWHKLKEPIRQRIT
jgi:hypothetical protein